MADTPRARSELLPWVTKRAVAAAASWHDRLELLVEDDVPDPLLARLLVRDRSVLVRVTLAARGRELPGDVRDRLGEDRSARVRRTLRAALIRSPRRQATIGLEAAALIVAHSNPASDPDEPAADRDPQVALALLARRPQDRALQLRYAATPTTDPAVLTVLTEAVLFAPLQGANPVLELLASHPEAPRPVLERLVECGGSLSAIAAANPNADEALVHRVVDAAAHDPFINLAPLAHRPLDAACVGPVAAALLAADEPDGSALAALARQAHATPAVLADIAAALRRGLGGGRLRPRAVCALPALVAHPSTPSEALGAFPVGPLCDRHRAMLLARLLHNDVEAEIAAVLWDDLDGPAAEVVERIGLLAGGAA